MLLTPVVRTTSPSRATQLLAMGWIPSMPATLLSPSPLGVRHHLLVCSGRSLPTASWEWTMPTQHFGSKCMIRMPCRSKNSACASIGSRSLPRMVRWPGPSRWAVRIPVFTPPPWYFRTILAALVSTPFDSRRCAFAKVVANRPTLKMTTRSGRLILMRPHSTAVVSSLILALQTRT